MYSNSRRPNLKKLGAKTVAVASTAALIATAFPVAALAAGVTPDGVTGNSDYNKTGKAIINGEGWDSWDDTDKALQKTENADGSVSYTDIADDDSSHFNGYGITTTITTDKSGLITAIDLSSGDETFAGAWGYKNSNRAVTPIEGYLPDGVTFQMTANDDGTYTPSLSGADTYKTYDVSSTTDRKTRVTTYTGVVGYTTDGSTLTEVENGVTYDPSTKKITVNDAANVNLIKVNWKIGGGTLTFNTYYALGTDAQKTAAQNYIDGIQATTWDASPDLTGTMASTNRDKWTAVTATVLLQRQLASWSATLQGAEDSEIDELDTVSGATCTSRTVVDALNKAVTDGYAKGVAENVKITIDKGKTITGTTTSDSIDVNADPSDSASVTTDADGNYVLSNDFPTGADRSQTHSVTINSISTYSLSNATTKDVADIAKGRSNAKALNTYTLKSGEPIGYDEDDGDPIYPTDWSAFVDPDGKIAVKYTSQGPWTITAKDKSITHIAVNYTLGHGTITLVYDLQQMKAAGDVQAQIAKLTSKSSASAVKKARTAYNALSTDVRGFVNNIDKLKKLEASVKAANTLTAKGSTKTVKLAKVKKASQTVKAITVSKAKGTVTYAKKSGSAKLTVNKKTGKVTVKKGTKVGTYKAQVTVKAAGTSKYNPGSKTVTVTVKVKK